MIDKIIKWIESNKWGKKLMIEITRRKWEEFLSGVHFLEQGYGYYVSVGERFLGWLDKEGE